MVNTKRLDKILDRALGHYSFWRDADPRLAARAAREERVVRVARELCSLGRNDLAAQLLDDAVAERRQSEFGPAA